MEGLLPLVLMVLIFFAVKRARRESTKDNKAQHGAASAAQYATRAKPKNPTHRITYTDANGNQTSREVGFYKSGHTNDKFQAWCFLRNSRRTFFFKQVAQAIDLETGEVMTRAQLFAHIHPTRRVPDLLNN